MLQGGMFSSLIDKYPCDLSFESEPGLTQVRRPTPALMHRLCYDQGSCGVS